MMTYKELFRLDAIESKDQLMDLMPLYEILQQHDAAFYEGRTDEPLMDYDQEMLDHLRVLVHQYVDDHVAIDLPETKEVA